jgi:dienelactone hydrolase
VAALTLGACASQPPDKVQLSIGMQTPELAQARDYAALYTPYAMMATAAYTKTSGVNVHHCPDIGRLRIAQQDESRQDGEFRQSVRGWIKELNARGWECWVGIVGSLPCPPRAGSRECKPVGGLEFHVWRRMQKGRCREVAIAFRGTDRHDLGDWASNFRFLRRLKPKFDEYAQVQTHITKIVQRIKHNGCNGAQIIATGHSLGGGLAQQAAYADASGSIRYVYGFDPSPVTGFFDVSSLTLKQSTEGLGIDRAYEQGEILSVPRQLAENILPSVPCHPRIRSVRFNLLRGLPSQQHSMEHLTKQLRIAARQPGANPKRVEASAKARSCKSVPLMLPSPA